MSKNKALSDFVSDISNAAVGDYLFLDSAGDRTIARQVLGSDISGFTAPYDSAGVVSLLDSSYVDTQLGGGGATSITGVNVDSKLAALDNSVVPTTSMNLGSPTKKWRNIYTNKLSFGGISIDTNGLDGGNATLSGFTTPSDYVLVNNIVLSTPAAVASAVTNSYYSSFLLKTDSTQTDAQVDASTNSLTITENGNVTSTAFSPYHPKGYSTYFDGSGDYLTVANGFPAIGTGDYTVEFWMYRTEGSGSPVAITDTRTSSINNPLLWIKDTDEVYYYTDGADAIVGTTQTKINQWYHVALSRSSGVSKLFINGVQEGSSYSDSHSYTQSTLFLGQRYTSTAYNFAGYISDFRIVNGTGVYTSNFTAPTERLTAIINTELLTCHSALIADGSSNDLSITVAGDTHTQQFGPYDHVAYSPSDHGGSVYFDGSGDYMTVGAASDWKFLSDGSTDCTIEGWIYMPSTTLGRMEILSTNTNTVIGGYGVTLGASVFSAGDLSIQYANGLGGVSGQFLTTSGSGVIKPKTWTHFACVLDISATEMKIYINGNLVTTGTKSYTFGNSNPNYTLNIGRWVGPASGDGGYLNGWLSDLKVTSSAVYTADFTPPTEPLTAITNTQLLTCTNKNNIFDAAGGNLLTVNGDTTASTTQYKWSSSLYVDGTGDSLQFTIPTDLQVMGRTGTECTIECWVYMVSAPGSGTYGTAMYSQGTAGSSSGTNVVSFEIQENQTVRALINGAYSSITGCPISTGTVSTGQWTHLALVLYNNTWTIYINGTADGTATGSYPSGTTHTTAFIGRVFYGANRTTEMYIEDLRISPHTAIYTSNFTPPTAALEG